MTSNEQRDAFLTLIDASEIRGHAFDDRDIEYFLNTYMDSYVNDMVHADKNPRGVGFSVDTLRQLQLTGLTTKAAAYKRTDGDFMAGNEDNGALPKPYEDDGLIEYGSFVAIPNECLFVTLMRASIYNSACTRKNVKVAMIDETYYEQYINNGQRQPFKNLVWCVEYGSHTHSKVTDVSTKGMTGIDTNDGSAIGIDSQINRSHLLISGKDYYIDQYDLRYIKRPNRIVIDINRPQDQVNCELNPAVHNDIVEGAVKLAIGAVISKESKYQIAQQEVLNNS